MDYELIFWLVAGVICLVLFLAMAVAPNDAPVSKDTIRRVCGERTH